MKKGFTLLEVLVSMALFTMISLYTVKQISLIRNTKVAAFEELDLYDGLRSTFSILKSDLSQAFHILYDDLGEETKTAIIRNQQVPHTLFDGRKSEIVFTALSRRVYYEGKRECEETEISYFLQQKKGSKHSSLMKRESERIDEDLYQGGQVYTVLDNVTSLEFQYWDDKSGKWQDSWNSDAGNFRDRFPNAVKMKLAVVNNMNREVKMETVFKVAFANNEGFLQKL
jgi:general secretion pathway protein J